MKFCEFFKLRRTFLFEENDSLRRSACFSVSANYYNSHFALRTDCAVQRYIISAARAEDAVCCVTASRYQRAAVGGIACVVFQSYHLR